MRTINMLLLIIVVIQSIILLYLMGFHPDAKECMKLEDKLRDAKKENSNLLNQIRDLNNQVYALNWKLGQYNELEVDRMIALVNKAMQGDSSSDKQDE